MYIVYQVCWCAAKSPGQRVEVGNLMAHSPIMNALLNDSNRLRVLPNAFGSRGFGWLAVFESKLPKTVFTPRCVTREV